MVWPWSSSKDESSETSNGDPMRDLDPSLRAFLEKESPVKYKPSEPQAQASSPAQNTTPTSHPASDSSASVSPQAPSQSLHPDGRYANLWSTYRPLKEIEAENKTDQEKLTDIIAGYRDRKASIGRAALENCTEEQLALSDCFTGGGWKDRMTMCRAENRQFTRCYTLQGKFLKALGYFNTYDRPPEVDEQIQMHADTLYHRMLDQEKAVEKAKAEGLPIPTFPAILPSTTKNSISDSTNTTPSKSNSDSQAANTITMKDLIPEAQAALKERMKALPPEERELEERAITMEIAAGVQLEKHLGVIQASQDKARKQRKEQGKETISDRFISLFRWR